MEEFAHCSPDYFGISESENGREEEIRKRVRSIQWAPKNENGIEAAVILRRPEPIKPVEKSFLENLLSRLRTPFRREVREFEDSLYSFAGAYKWNLYLFHKKETLLLPDTVKTAKVLKKEGFDIQVLAPRIKKPKLEKLHRVAVTNGSFQIIARPFNDFYREERARAVAG